MNEVISKRTEQLLEYYGKRHIEGQCPKCLSKAKIDLWQHEDGYFDCPYCGYHFEIERLETEVS